MFPLKKQVQTASDHAKGAVARLTGKESPKMEDNEATLPSSGRASTRRSHM